MDFDKPRTPRTTTTRGASSPVRILRTATGIALAAVLLPSAISLASTGTIGSSTVLGALSGAKPKEEKVEQPRATALVRRATPQHDVKLAVLADTPRIAAVERTAGRRDARPATVAHRPADDHGRRRRDDAAVGLDPAGTKGADDASLLHRTGPAAEATTVPAADSQTTAAPTVDDTPHADDSKPTATPVRTVQPAPVRSAAPAATAPATDDSPATAPVVADDSSIDGSQDATADTSVDASADALATDGRREFSLAAGESVTLVVDVPTDDEALTMWTREAEGECAPHLAVLVDRELVGQIDASGTEWEDHAIEPAPDAGLHAVRLVAIHGDDDCTGEDGPIAFVEPVAGEAGTAAPADDVAAAGDAAGTVASSGTVDGSTGAEAATTEPAVTGAATTQADAATTQTDAATTDGSTATDAAATTTTDDRRHFVLRRGESVTVNVDLGAEDEAVTVWSRTDLSECASIVAMAVDRRGVDPLEVSGTDWQEHAVESAKGFGRHSVRLAYVGTKHDAACSDGSEQDAVTLVEPETGDAGAEAPQPVDATEPTTDDRGSVERPQPVDATEPTSDDPGSQPSQPVAPTRTASPTRKPVTPGAAVTTSFESTPWNVYGGATVNMMNDGAKGYVLRSFGAANQSQNGSQRAEQVPAPKFSNGQTVWTGFDLWVSPNLPVSSTWQSVMQFKTGGGQDGAPPVSLDVNAHGQSGLDIASARIGGTESVHELGAAPDGTWTRLLVGIHVNTDPNKAWVEVWRDGKQVLAREPWRTVNYPSYGSTVGGTMFSGGSGVGYFKFGVYRGPQGFDIEARYANLKFATTREAVL
jgi:hypothetical protein